MKIRSILMNRFKTSVSVDLGQSPATRTVNMNEFLLQTESIVL